MIALRSPLVAALVAAATLAVGAPAADATVATSSLLPVAAPTAGSFPGGRGAGVCSRSSGPEGQGGTGEVAHQVCQGAGLVFIGPSSGQISTVIGPTIISPGFAGTVVVSAGDAVAVGP
jgi:hypothetical protein